MLKIEFTNILKNVRLLDLSVLNSKYNLNNFEAVIDEYNLYIKNIALPHQLQKISHTHVMVNKKNDDIIAYITLITDSITLSPNEKDLDDLRDIPFCTLPAVKIAKLAVDKRYSEKYHGIGKSMVGIARGFAYNINENGVACRYLTVDADIENNKSVVEFYEKCGFRLNEKLNNKSRRTTSMRKDIFHD